MSSHWDYSRWESLCLCGKGRFLANWESENYPPFGQYFFASIECEDCAGKYHLVVNSLNDVRVSLHRDHAAQGAAVCARNAVWDGDGDVVSLCSTLRAKLDAMPSQAARYRWLREHELLDTCLAYFRRDYRDQPDWVVKNIVLMKPERFPFLAAALQRRAAVTIREVPIYAIGKLEWKSATEETA